MIVVTKLLIIQSYRRLCSGMESSYNPAASTVRTTQILNLTMQIIKHAGYVQK